MIETKTPDIQQTNFIPDGERRDMTVAETAPYVLFEPVVNHVNPDGSVEQLTRAEVFQQMKDYVTELGVEPNYSYPFGGVGTSTIGEIIDTQASAFLAEQNQSVQAPNAMIGILTTIAQLAERSGFDRNTATFSGSFMYEREVGNPNHNIHSDGLSGLVEDGTQFAKTTRFVYALGPGTLIYPKLDKEGTQMTADYNSPSGMAYIDSPTPSQVINAPRSANFTQEELMSADTQQVVPGVVLGFDPTRTFWHQAPSEPRPVLVINVRQVV